MNHRDRSGATKTDKRGVTGKVSSSPETDSVSVAPCAIAVDPYDADSPTGSYVVPTAQAESGLCYSVALELGKDALDSMDDSGAFTSWTAAELDAWHELVDRKEAGAQPLVHPSSPAALPIRVFVAAPEPLAIRGLRGLFEAEPGFDLIGEAQHSTGLLQQIESSTPEVVILDLNLPNEGGLAVAGALHEVRSPARVVLLAGRVDESEFLRARQVGVRGIVLKSMPLHLLLQCVRTVHAGTAFVDSDLEGHHEAWTPAHVA